MEATAEAAGGGAVIALHSTWPLAPVGLLLVVAAAIGLVAILERRS